MLNGDNFPDGAEGRAGSKEHLSALRVGNPQEESGNPLRRHNH